METKAILVDRADYFTIEDHVAIGCVAASWERDDVDYSYEYGCRVSYNRATDLVVELSRSQYEARVVQPGQLLVVKFKEIDIDDDEVWTITK